MLLMKVLHALMNLTAAKANQVKIAVAGVEVIWHIAMDTSRQNPQVHMYAARVLHNLSRHPKNRTRMYKLEQKFKAGQLRPLQHIWREMVEDKKTSGNRAEDEPDPQSMQKRQKRHYDAYIARQQRARQMDMGPEASARRYAAKVALWKKREMRVTAPSLLAQRSTSPAISARAPQRPQSANPMRKSRDRRRAQRILNE